MRRARLIQAVALALGLAILLSGCGASRPAGEMGRSGGTETQTNPVPTGEQEAAGSTGGQSSSSGPGNGSGPGQGNGPGHTGGEQGARPARALPNLPGDMAALEAALGESTPLHYKVSVADTPRGVDINAYLDQVIAEKGFPGENEIWLLIFPTNNYDIRFVMGAFLFEKKLTVGAMLDLVRGRYLPRARAGDPAGGLADLIRAVNQAVR